MGAEANGDWRAAWVTALDRLEADVTEVERMLTADHREREMPRPDPWSPPEGLGPLPLDLRPRADAILARQIAATRQVALALAANRRLAEAAARIEAGRHTEPSRPAYVDCSI